jgi:hypothetical protein
MRKRLPGRAPWNVNCRPAFPKRDRRSKEEEMSVARVTEISATSPQSFDDAVKQGIARATDSLRNVKSAWIKDSNVEVENGNVKEYRVNMEVTFVLD